MTFKKVQVPFIQESSNLEVEAWEIVVNTTNGYFAPESEQDKNLGTLTTESGNVEIAALLTGTSPVNGVDCCCCCCPMCCCG